MPPHRWNEHAVRASVELWYVPLKEVHLEVLGNSEGWPSAGVKRLAIGNVVFRPPFS